MVEASSVATVERRKSTRIRLDVPVRYILANHEVYEGSIVNASLAGLAIAGPERGRIGEHVTINVNGIGKFEGEVTRHSKVGFAVKLVGDRAAVVQAIAGLIEHQQRQTA